LRNESIGLIRLTPAALAKRPELMSLRDQAVQEALAGFDKAERKLLAGMLLRIIAKVEKAAKPGMGREANARGPTGKIPNPGSRKEYPRDRDATCHGDRRATDRFHLPGRPTG
jgi:hypothetical protein